MRGIQLVASAAAAVLIAGSVTRADIVIDGQLDPGYGTALSTQTNASNSMEGSNYNQLSVAYGTIDTANNKLDLFIGGSLRMSNAEFVLAIQTNGSGVSDLHTTTALASNDGNDGVNNPGGGASGLENLEFDSGFKPNALFTFKYDGGRESDYFNLANNSHVGYGYGANPDTNDTGVQTKTAAGAPTYTIATNNSLANQQIGGTGSTAFGDATTGVELQFDLTALGYTGGNINVMPFLSQGSFTGATNQVLAPYAPNPDHTGDYPYLSPNRQFDNDSFYPGSQYFTVAVPEPASLGLAGLLAVAAMRRSRKVKA